MLAIFYISALVAVAATLLMLTRKNAVHGLLYLVVSLLAVALVFYALGAPFAAALEVIIYAGAIMVLFLFVVMMLNLGERSERAERECLRPGVWRWPGVLAAILIAEVVYVVALAGAGGAQVAVVGPTEVGMALFGPYVIGVELASLLLLAGVVSAYHLGRRQEQAEGRQ